MENTSLKKERIGDTDSAANSNVFENKDITPEVKETNVNENKQNISNSKDMLRLVVYPVVVGSVFGIGGSLLASKLNKNKKLFVISGILVGAGLGYALYLNKNKKII